MDDRLLSEIGAWARDARSIVVMTGAGISTESGIPDFRGPQGVWTKNPEAERAATLQHYMAHPDARTRSWQNRLSSPMDSAQPNAGHLALAELERKAALSMLVTQNIDGLHHRAGSDPSRIVEIHGNVREFMCMNCDDRGPIDRVLDRVRAGEDDPPCRTCGGVLKSATISFGQNLVPADLARAERAAAACDLFFALGTSLAVYPVASLPAIALRVEARLVIMNAEETPYDHVAHAIIRDPLGTALPALVAAI
ncbi:MAG: SIR2 family NAD-dependent protein deacylase [Tepidiformaceae bacterium]